MELSGELNDPESAPEPPPEVVQPLLWRMGVRLIADHQVLWPAPPWQSPPACRNCGQPWPCPGRRLGERGVLASMEQPRPRPWEGR